MKKTREAEIDRSNKRSRGCHAAPLAQVSLPLNKVIFYYCKYVYDFLKENEH
jgi:hypothetical protein